MGLNGGKSDLGCRDTSRRSPFITKQLIKKANSLGIPIITATQMLDSMTGGHKPTRAELVM